MNKVKLISVTTVSVCAVFIIMLYSACIKNPLVPDTNYHISGTLYRDCHMVPFANQQLTLYLKGSSSDCDFKGGQSTTTDNNGNFSFSYKDGGCVKILDSRQLYIRSATGIEINVPIDQNIDVGQLFFYPNTSMKVRVVSARPDYKDTLYFGENDGFDSNHLFPITDTVITIRTIGNFADSVSWNFGVMRSFKAGTMGSVSIYRNCPTDSATIILP